jgi:epoxide hydrolase-like predicted phosphatase
VIYLAIKAVVFDFGGVLVRTEDSSGRVKWEKRLGLNPGELSKVVFDSDASVQASVGKLPFTAVWEHVAQTFSLSPAEADQLCTDFFSGDRMDAVLVEFLKSLRPRYKTAILSNAMSDARNLFSQTYHLDPVVDCYIISAEEKMVKPDPAFYRLACDRLGVQPEEMVFVDDFIQNVDGALAVGIKAYQFKGTPDLLSELKLVL